MIYVSILTFVFLNVYYLDKIIASDKKALFFLSIIPSFFVLVVFPSLQGGVGGDYSSYMDIYEGNIDELNRFFYRGEYAFYYIFKFILDFKLGGQTIFFISTFINMALFSFYLCYFRKLGYSAWLFFVCFFVVTNIYHNQMNGIRQYIALMLLPGVFLLFCNRRYLLSILFLVFATFFHFTAWVAILIYPAVLVAKLSRLKQFIIFLSLSFFMLYLGGVIEFIVNNFFQVYVHYLNSEYGEGLGGTSIISKLYYLPVFLFFWYCYLKEDVRVDLPYLKEGVAIWCCTYWMFLLYLSFGFSYRISAYFFFFYIFPLIYIYRFLALRKKTSVILLYLIYLISPYLFKVLFSPKGVFIYKTFLF